MDERFLKSEDGHPEFLPRFEPHRDDFMTFLEKTRRLKSSRAAQNRTPSEGLKSAEDRFTGKESAWVRNDFMTFLAHLGVSPRASSEIGQPSAQPSKSIAWEHNRVTSGFSTFLYALKELEPTGGTNAQTEAQANVHDARKSGLLKYMSQPITVRDLLEVSGLRIDELAKCLDLLLQSGMIKASGLTARDKIELTSLGQAAAASGGPEK